MADSQMSVDVDVDEVSKVVAFYRRAADVVGSAAEDIRTHELGRWAIGEEFREMGERYQEMGRVITGRLADQAHAADRLADALGRGIAIIEAADDDNAAGLTRSVGRHRADGPGAA